MILWNLPKRWNLPSRRDLFKCAAASAAGAALPEAHANILQPSNRASFGGDFGQTNSIHHAEGRFAHLKPGKGNVSISVLNGYHPSEFTLRPIHGTALVVEANIGPKGELAILKNEKRSMHLTGPTKVTGHYGLPAHFWLGVPGHPEREYFGRLEIKSHGDHLLAIVDMDLETAVASIVHGEGTAGLPFEARRAQAVATRSYLMAAKGHRHTGFDFCDQDHCQFLVGAPALSSASARAASSTRGKVLTYKGSVIAALYSANCGGHTRTLHQAGWQDGSPAPETYPFFVVSCPLQGPVSGHRVGMCQSGAIEIAKQGKPAGAILGYYFPNTSIGTV